MRRTLCAAACFVLAAGALAQNGPAQARELLESGTQLIASKPAEAVRVLEQALRLDPELPALRYQLGLAYHAIGDEADAADQLRLAVGRDPQSAAAHNYLGIALFLTGDAKAALEQFRAAAQLAPKDPNAHFNLGEALARTGDSQGAVGELRIASGLAPGDAGLARLLESVETRRAAPEGAFKVDVRQVLVPVVVTDPQGHHVTGLTQADFRVFEDGVEQKITSFTVERSGVPLVQASEGATAPVAQAASNVPPAASSAPKPRRTYMVLIDTLHTTLQHLAAAREALVKLFQEEHSEDSQYVAVALGVSPEMVINVTRDASAVLAALGSKRIQKIFQDGQVGGVQPEMDRFRRDLNEIRYACDLAGQDAAMEVKCAAGLTRLADQSRLIAELDRTLATEFLRQFRSLVAQLARARDRRTIVLISDGFPIEPGRQAFALLDAYFPFASHCLVPADVYCPPNAVPSATRMAGEFEPILKLAAAANVTIDTLDARGLFGQQAFDASTSGTSPAVDGAVGRAERNNAAAGGNTLAEIAAATGGTAFHDSNNLLGGLERAFADGRDYYTIAYVPANGNYDGKFRAITVRVRDPKALVNAKRGYWATPGAQ